MLFAGTPEKLATIQAVIEGIDDIKKHFQELRMTPDDLTIRSEMKHYGRILTPEERERVAEVMAIATSPEYGLDPDGPEIGSLLEEVVKISNK